MTIDTIIEYYKNKIEVANRILDIYYKTGKFINRKCSLNQLLEAKNRWIFLVQLLKNIQITSLTKNKVPVIRGSWGLDDSCGNCHKALNGDEKYCPNCGYKLIWERY